MKKLFILGAMLLTATFTLTNCTEEILGPVGPEEVPYTIFANAAETKTVNSGFSTLWAEGDSLSVFHAPAGTDKYSGNSRFDLVDAAEGKFVTTNLVGELAGSNDWYVFYPYSKYLVTPASTSKGYMVVASPYNKAQTQTGNNSMAHIAGENYPMWGVAENVSGEDLPGVTMTHLTSLVEVVVTNVTDAELTVSSVALTGTEPIVGTYFMDFTGETPLYTVSNDKYVSEVATLDVVNGESIPVSGNAKFYFAVKPFTAPAGQVLTLSVNGKEKVMTLVADVTFEPGKVKTLNYVYEGGAVNPGDKDFELDKKEVSVSGTGGEFDVTVFSTIGYKISSTPDWVEEISKTEDPSAYTTVHTFRVAANTGPEPRSGVIVFCNDNLVCMPVTVNQEGNTVQGDWINKNFYHRSVAMRFTADWCGHCPNMASGLDLAKSNMVDKLEVLSVHGGGGLVFSEASSWLNQYLIESFPMGIIDGRKLVLNYSSQNYLAQLTEEYALETENIYSTVSGVSMSSTVDGRNVNVKIDAYFKAADSYKLTALLVEDNVIAWQADYVSGDQNDYVHKGVVRMALSDVDGESITTSENEIKSFSYKASVPEKYDIDNMSVVVFVQRPFGSRQVIQDGAYGDYYIDNCASGKVGETVALRFEGDAPVPEEKIFELDKKEVSVSAGGGDFDVTVHSTIGYKISSMPDWVEEISTSNDKASKTTVHSFRVAANTGTAAREGTIVFCNDDSVCVPVTVNQEGQTAENPDWSDKMFWHRSVAMRFTADWCGNCPNMVTALKYAQTDMPDKLEVISLHGSGGLAFAPTSYLMDQYSVTGYPTGIVDGRIEVWNSGISSIVSNVLNTLAETEENYPTQSGVSFESSLSGRNLTLNSTIYLKKAGTYKITALLVEDNVVGYQAGGSDNYVHEGVARVALSDIMGDEISTVSDNQEVSKTYSCSIPSGYNLDNMRIVIYIHAQYGSQKVISSGNYGDYYIDNSATGKVGTDLVLRFAGDVPTPEKDDRFDPDFLRFLLNADNLKNNGTPDGKVDADGDGFLSGVELANITGLNLNDSGVVSLRGIELMRNLQYFKYENGGLQSLDLSKNVEVNYIYCRNNSISEAALPGGGYLRTLDLSNNNLSSLDLSQNTRITTLKCSGNKLTELDLSTNLGIEILDCSSNRLSTLDISSIGCFYTEAGQLYVGNQSSTLTLYVSQKQEEIWNQYWKSLAENANVTLSVFGQPSIKKPNVIIFSQPEEFYCDGVYDHTGGHGFVYDLNSSIDRSFFSISCDYYVDPDVETGTGYMAILVLSHWYRAFGINISEGKLQVTINNQDAVYETSVEVRAGEWHHVEVVYNNGDMLVNDEYFKAGTIDVEGDNVLSSTNYGAGDPFKGKLANIVVKSGYEGMSPGGNIDDIPVEEW